MTAGTQRTALRVTASPGDRAVSPTEKSCRIPVLLLPRPCLQGQGCVTHREILQESCPAAAPQALPAGMRGPGSPRALRGTGKAACPEASFTLKSSEALNPHFRLLLPINGIFGSPLGQPLRRTEPLLVPTSLEHRERRRTGLRTLKNGN